MGRDSGLDDATFVRRLLELLAAEDPADGIDRKHGYGRHYWVDDLRVVTADDGLDDLEIVCGQRTPWWVMLRPSSWFRRPRSPVVGRTLFDRAWRVESGLDDPVSMAPRVADAALGAVTNAWSQARHGHADPRVVAAADAATPPAQAVWDRLVADLDGRVVGPDRFVVDDSGASFTVVVTPEDWRACVVDAETLARGGEGYPDEPPFEPGDGFGLAAFELDEEIGSTTGSERFIVHFRGAFHRSIRADGPPVTGDPDPDL